MSVYAIQGIEGGPIKIGYSADPEGRLVQLQGAHHAELVVIYSFKAERRYEAWLHEHLSDYRLRGEWFRDDPEILFRLRTLEVGLRLERLVRAVTTRAMDAFGRDFSREHVAGELAAFAHEVADALAAANTEVLSYIDTAKGFDPDALRALDARLSREDAS